MTGSHLSEERLCELGCGRSAAPRNGEKAHLEACPTCSRRLEDERRLSSLFAEIAIAPQAAAFAARARARYERETRTIAVRRALVLILGLVVAVDAWLLVAGAGAEPIAADLADTVAAGATVFCAASAVVAASPFGFAVCIAVVSTALIAACAALAALIRGSVIARAPAEARSKEV